MTASEATDWIVWCTGLGSTTGRTELTVVSIGAIFLSDLVLRILSMADGVFFSVVRLNLILMSFKSAS